ncbi:MAG: hypothetical protein IT559_04845 [Alphaproteobacteria bacterium]|nr:hypothetical protein [Alphaproteobacteria bacterium]
MIARQLERILEDHTRTIHISSHPYGHVSARFEKMRGYNLLPKGTVRNSKHLTTEEIAAGILSLVAPQIGFAGHTALILKTLCPVGGVEASFQKAPTFVAALEAILSSTDTLNELIKVTVSDSEIYTNGHGRAAIHYRAGDTEKVSYYVDRHAVTLMQSGADKGYDPSQMITTMTNDMVFYPSFFRPIVESLKREASMPPVIYPEEPETDEELEKQRRAEYLKLTPYSNFLNMAVDCQVTWPKEEKLVEFDGYRLVLLPKTKDHTTSIHIDLHGNRVGREEARTIINRFLSLLTWCDDQYAVVQEGWSGNPVPVPAPKRDLAFSTAHHWIFDRNLPNDDGRKALAIYREGRNSEQNYLISFAVLSYYKIIEIRYRGRSETRTWFRDSYAAIKNKIDPDIIKRFENYRGEKPVENYLYDACRSAVAHANKPESTDPDEFEELNRLHNVAYVLRQLARYFIKNELGLSAHYFDGS